MPVLRRPQTSVKLYNIRSFVLAITVFIAFSSVIIREAHGFEYFEHKYIGDVAFTKVINKLRNKYINENKEEEEKTEEEKRIETIIDIMEKLFDIKNEKMAETIPCITQKEKDRMIDYPEEELKEYLSKYYFYYGDLAAMAGDHYEDPDDLKKLLTKLNNEKGKTDKKLLLIMKVIKSHFADVKKWYVSQKSSYYDDQLQCVENNKTSIINQRQPVASYETSLDEEKGFVNLPDFSSLLAGNSNHFRDETWEEWKDNHEEAIKYAKEINKYIYGKELNEKENTPEKFEEKIFLMLSYEGYAQHFLADAFAAGHIDTKRSFFYPPSISGNKHDYFNRYGLWVGMTMPRKDNGKNEEEEYWLSYGDKALFTPDATENRKKVIEMSEWSLHHVLSFVLTEDKGTVAKNELEDDDLVIKLLDNNILKNVENDPDSVRFVDSITDEDQLESSIEQIGGIEIEPILAIWRQSHKGKEEKYKELERPLPVIEFNYKNLNKIKLEKNIPEKEFKNKLEAALFGCDAIINLENRDGNNFTLSRSESKTLSEEAFFNLSFNKKYDDELEDCIIENEKEHGEEIAEHIEDVWKKSKEKLSLDLPPFRESGGGLSFALTYYVHHNDLRLDIGYGYGRNPNKYFTFNYLGADIYLTKENEKSAHLVIGSRTSLDIDNGYYPLEWQSIFFLDKVMALFFEHIIIRPIDEWLIEDFKDFFKIWKFSSNMSFGMNYWGTSTEHEKVEALEFIYSVSLTINVIRNLNIKFTSDMVRILEEDTFEFNFRRHEEFFPRGGFGLEFVF